MVPYRGVTRYLPFLQRGWCPAAKCHQREPALYSWWLDRWVEQAFASSQGLKRNLWLQPSSPAQHWVLLGHGAGENQTPDRKSARIGLCVFQKHLCLQCVFKGVSEFIVLHLKAKPRSLVNQFMSGLTFGGCNYIFLRRRTHFPSGFGSDGHRVPCVGGQTSQSKPRVCCAVLIQISWNEWEIENGMDFYPFRVWVCICCLCLITCRSIQVEHVGEFSCDNVGRAPGHGDRSRRHVQYEKVLGRVFWGCHKQWDIQRLLQAVHIATS